jgi:hydroxymethylglutaryl-CoA reductase (NADPH)
VNASCIAVATPRSLALAFRAGALEEYGGALRAHAHALPNAHLLLATGAVDVRPATSSLASAFLALAARFRALLRTAALPDVLLVGAGYLLMHVTFFRVLRASRTLGSHFWLAAAVLTSACLSFLLALLLALHARLAVDPFLLTEALPFLVCTVGFDKPLRLARALFTHEGLYTPPSPSHSRSPSHSSANAAAAAAAAMASSHPPPRGVLPPASTLLLAALDRSGNAILRDYLLEILVLLLGASSRVGGLRECCALASTALSPPRSTSPHYASWLR